MRSACSILAADRYGDDTIARDEDVNDFFAKWINKLLVDELIAHLEDDIGTVDESAPDHLQSVEETGRQMRPARVALRWK